MPPQTIESRVERLERRVTELEQLPARIDDLTLQISQLCTEMRDEFSAVRGEMAEQGRGLRAEMAEQGESLRAEMAEQSATIISTLRTEIADRDEARGTHMRVLYEDVISRIALLQEGLAVRRKRKNEKGSWKSDRLAAPAPKANHFSIYHLPSTIQTRSVWTLSSGVHAGSSPNPSPGSIPYPFAATSSSSSFARCRFAGVRRAPTGFVMRADASSGRRSAVSAASTAEPHRMPTAADAEAPSSGTRSQRRQIAQRPRQSGSAWSFSAFPHVGIWKLEVGS